MKIEKDMEGHASVSDPVVKLRAVLANLPPGPVAPEALPSVTKAMIRAWYLLDGHDETGLRAHRLRDMEDPEWEPPCLRFRMERHGKVVLGSTRAEVETWEVNVERGTACVFH